MPKLSDQFREAIRLSGTSRYSLAKQVGVSESALSRFMSGKQGLTLATLDKLAEVLGLQLTTTILQVQPSAPVGRRPKWKAEPTERKKPEPPEPELTSWMRAAVALAKHAYDNYLYVRRGAWYVSSDDVLCFYNNNPYAKYPSLRDDEVAEFRARLKQARIKELAYATYPPPGAPDAGYTFAMLVDARKDRMQELSGWWESIIEARFERRRSCKEIDAKVEEKGD